MPAPLYKRGGNLREVKELSKSHRASNWHVVRQDLYLPLFSDVMPRGSSSTSNYTALCYTVLYYIILYITIIPLKSIITTKYCNMQIE